MVYGQPRLTPKSVVPADLYYLGIGDLEFAPYSRPHADLSARIGHTFWVWMTLQATHCAYGIQAVRLVH